MDDQISRAEAIAVLAHRGQVDKAGQPYIEHPRRVAAAVRHDDLTYCVALLHDVVEDSDITLDDLAAAGIDARVIHAVSLLTRRADVASDTYYRRIRDDERALAVKIADIRDNLNAERLAQLDPDTRARLERKYAAALAALTREV